MGNIDNQHANDLEMAQEADWTDGLAERATVIDARRQHIADNAPCVFCRTDLKTCRVLGGETPGPAGLCCSRHNHPPDQRALNALLDEVAAGGRVRTVAEVDPPPVLGPRRVTDRWLLRQDVWWYPKGRPAVRIAEMDKPWRFNTARFIERRAAVLADQEYWSMASIRSGPFGPGGDMACDAFDREMHDVIEDPLGWLRSTPLLRALRKGLPSPDGEKGRKLAERAVHWSTCPRRKAHPARQRCTCIRVDGRTVGATNDPTAVTA